MKTCEDDETGARVRAISDAGVRELPREFTEVTSAENVFDNLYIPPEIATTRLVKRIDSQVSGV